MKLRDSAGEGDGKGMTLNKRLQWLKKRGCYPSIYLRGNLWRAHINAAGNFWDDAESPTLALENAVKLWKKQGCPIDGRGADNTVDENEIKELLLMDDPIVSKHHF